MSDPQKRINFKELNTPWKNDDHGPIPDLRPKQSTIDYLNDLFTAHNKLMEAQEREHDRTE